MNDKELRALCDEVVAEESQKSGFQMNAFTGRFADVVAWLRSQGITLLKLFANFQKILEIISLPDPPNTWIVKLQKILELFFTQENRPQIEFPSWAS